MNVSYDYDLKGLKLVHSGDISEKIKHFELHVRSCPVEKFDDPVVR
jgi:hypothetical protein